MDLWTFRVVFSTDKMFEQFILFIKFAEFSMQMKKNKSKIMAQFRMRNLFMF